jgi:uncharacterized DUF497 family protein
MRAARCFESVSVVNFEWDADKAKADFERHGISLIKRMAVFGEAGCIRNDQE